VQHRLAAHQQQPLPVVTRLAAGRSLLDEATCRSSSAAEGGGGAGDRGPADDAARPQQQQQFDKASPEKFELASPSQLGARHRSSDEELRLPRARRWLRTHLAATVAKIDRWPRPSMLEVLRGSLGNPTAGGGDSPLACEQWLELLGKHHYAGRLEEAVAAFEAADFRGAGAVPSAELLFEEVWRCRRWCHERVGPPQRVHAELERFLVFRTARQLDEGKVSREQWAAFMRHLGWAEGGCEAFACLDPRGEGELSSFELVGLEARLVAADSSEPASAGGEQAAGARGLE